MFARTLATRTLLSYSLRAASQPSHSYPPFSRLMSAQAGRPKVVQSRKMPTELLNEEAKKGAIDLVCWTEDRPAPRDWLLEQVKGASGLICTAFSDKIDGELLRAAGSSLKVVSTYSVGYDHIDLSTAKEMGVRVGHTPEVLDDAVADLTLCLALMATRRIGESLNIVRDGKWPQMAMAWSPLTLCGPSIAGATIGFYGFGRIAQKTALRLLPLGPSQILYTVSSPRPFTSSYAPLLHPLVSGSSAPFSKTTIANEPDLKQLAKKADVFFVMTSLSPATKHAINADVLALMKRSAVIVNTGRGPVIDTDALVAALREERIGAAGLDVVEGEPNIPKDHPLLQPPLSDKVVLIPHIGSATTETRITMADMAVNNLLGGIGIRPQMEREVQIK